MHPILEQALARSSEEWRYGIIQEPSPQIRDAARLWLAARLLLSTVVRRKHRTTDLVETTREQLDRAQQACFDAIAYDRSYFVVDNHLVRVQYHLVYGHPIRVEAIVRSSRLHPNAGRGPS